MSKISIDRNIATKFQGIYYVASGLWPLLHMRSFEAVTGPKRDKWLVNTVGALIVTIGSTILISAARERERDTAVNLGISAALALIGIDSIYSKRGTIKSICWTRRSKPRFLQLYRDDDLSRESDEGQLTSRPEIWDVVVEPRPPSTLSIHRVNPRRT